MQTCTAPVPASSHIYDPIVHSGGELPSIVKNVAGLVENGQVTAKR